MKTIEPSDVVRLLGDLAQDHNDATCQALYVMAAKGSPILLVCYEAIRALAGEKARATKMAIDLTMLQPLAPIVITAPAPEGTGTGEMG